MKTILYNPIFINPQAYYVFPRLTRYLQPDNESTAEPANYIGTIEVKVIAYGDTTLKRTYTNTDSIDLSEFKNTWIRISLFTKVGSCVLGEWKIGNMESDLPYIDPEVLASLKAVVIVGNKTNNDSDRAIVKNLVDPDNPFVISNAAFKLNSGFGKYGMDFLEWKANSGMNFTSTKLTSTKPNLPGGWLTFRNVSGLISETKVKVSGAPKEFVFIGNNNGADDKFSVTINNGVYTIPEFTLSSASGFYINNNSGDWSNLVIEQIPSFEGAFVTDGIDDLIKSTKSATEMLDGSNEVTVVSMIHQIKTNDDTTRNNWFFTPVSYLENRVVKDKIGKTGIYGYTSTNVTNAQISDITPILGDKNDYTLYSKIEDGDRDYFTVEGFQNQGIWYVSSIAWYWTIIANKVLTTDQINQVIAYFNLDRTLKPDILCNTIKQGITNENHAEFGDKLIDFSGNGRDIQLNNLAWDGDSGIGKYNYPNWKVTATIANTYSTIVNYPTVNGTYSINVNGVSELMQSIGLHLEIKYTTSTGIIYKDIKQDGVYSYILPDGATDLTLRFGGIPGIVNEPCNITITQIPSHAGALCLDGVNDFGKVTGMPIYKDYTVVADYIRTSAKENAQDSPILSKSQVVNNGAFVFNYLNINSVLSSYSFGINNGLESISDSERKIYYQSKYVNDGKSINSGTGIDYNSMWLGTYRDNVQIFFNGAIYSLMSFPYSMSKFLIERQLKKYKLGTLYPNMVEFRPIVKSNSEYQVVDCYIDTLPAVVGNYYPINSKLRIAVTTKGAADEVTSLTVNGVSLGTPSVNGNRFTFNGTLSDKSPQKINITIDEYIRYEDIVQPYPVLLRFNDENGNEVSWGGKFRVGSTITRIGSFYENNLIDGLYIVRNPKLNGNNLITPTHVVEKSMVFTCDTEYLLDNNEPKCILSPSRLRMPNSSYKILGYIPDISGHGNHGVIHNSAYAGMSGANGYTEDFTKWTLYTGVKCTDSIISLDSSFNKQDQWILFKPKGSNINQFTINIKGIPDGGNLYLRLSTDSNIKLENGINEISSYTNVTNSTGFFIGANGLNLDWSNLVIEQVGEYEGAYCLDGVDDFVTIPTVTGGKQVLMKVNWQSIAGTAILYDQRTNGGFAIFNRDYDTNENKVPAYRARNIGGNTYIDGILNEYIYASQLQNITHNIVELYDPELNIGTLNPKIGSSYLNSNYAQMSLYDFMLFDNISTDDKIKQLNEYVGIECNTEWRKTK